MPIYEYRCKSCGQHLEIIQKVGERTRRKCDRCGGRLEKLVSRTAFVLKGGGWYAEGYSRGGGERGDTKSKKKEAASDGKNAPASKSGDGTGGGNRSASAG